MKVRMSIVSWEMERWGKRLKVKQACLIVLRSNDRFRKKGVWRNKGRIKVAYRKRKKKITEQFGSKMNGYLLENEELVWKKVIKIKKENKGKFHKIMNRDNSSLTDEMNIRRVWRILLKLLNIVSNKEVILNVCWFGICNR